MKKLFMSAMLLLNIAAPKLCDGSEQGRSTLAVIPEEESAELWKEEMQRWIAEGEGHSVEPVQSPRSPKVPAEIVGAVRKEIQEKLERKSDQE